MSWSWSWVISSQNYIKIIPLVMFLTTNFSNHLKKLFHNWCMQEKNNPTLHFWGCFWDVKICHIIFLIYFFKKNTTKHDGNIFCECFLWVDIQRTSIRGQALNIMSRVFDEMALEPIHNGSLYTYVSSSSKIIMHKFLKK
jgi:hypothetical protein